MTALSATYQAAAGAAPPSVLLAVSAAPSLTPPYVSSFTVGSVDGWTGSAGTALAYTSGYTVHGVYTPPGMNVTTAAETLGTFSRTVTGLAVGATYKLTLMALATAGKIQLGVSGMTSGPQLQPTGRSPLTYTFTATTTTHTIQVLVSPPVTSGTDTGRYRLDTIKVARTSDWLGTTIYRTDANGTAAVREAPPGQDATGTSGSATLTVTDYEAALVGTVEYAVIDGNGGTAAASVSTPPGAGSWLTLPATADPATPTPPRLATVQMATGYDETSESQGTVHTVLGRADKLSNPGTLLARTGTLELFCTGYAQAADIRDLLRDAATALFRQADYPGLDLYLVARSVYIVPAEPTPVRRWLVTISYDEVPRP